MALFDLPLDELRDYRPRIEEPDDFDAFWSTTLAETRAHRPGITFEPVDTPLTGLRVWDTTFAGYGGHPVKGWFSAPAHAEGPLPLVVQFHGYNGGRSLPHCWGLWPLAGFAHFIMDVRGQGSGGNVGDTPDPVGSGPSHAGFMTRGIEAPESYYYRRVYADAVRAVEAARTHPLADPARTVALGGSQGGGLALAVGGLVPDLAAVSADVPFLCHFGRAVTLTDANPYSEIARYLKIHRGKEENVLRTLSYFDGVSFAARGNAPALFSVALQDQTCPPSTVFAAYNAYRGEKEIEVYPFNGHEGGAMFQEAVRLRRVPALLDRDS
ncbi:MULTISPECIES: acetylxylan esterase [unclassified Streptomyces]|uniref:acetylxylan esterase n=1 Tax=unclassified Streptomyces TaxID=2593676 RepID=UPI00093E0541|nr:acetylxylan esterase [Streptomyces sp. TSRI0281]OKI43243.1 acetylxylan esterase [Streptomyces sp. TSRI0281]